MTSRYHKLLSQTLALIALAWFAGPALAQPTFPPASAQSSNAPANDWSSRGAGPVGQQPNAAPRAHIARVTTGTDVLPRTAGQVWRNYDISPFTRNFPPESRPQQEIIDWILRETGTDLWFSEPLGILSATNDTLRVYHSPEVQAVVHDIVDRFVDPNASSLVLTFHLVTVGSPNWRSRAFSILQPVQVQSDGLQGWLISKENAAILLGELKKRNDFQEIQGPSVFVASGRTEILTRTRPINYVQGLIPNPANPSAATPSNDSINEGYALEISALKSLEPNIMEAVVKCHVNQLEKLQPVQIDLFNPLGQPQRTQIQVPQMVNWRLHERFKWPANQILLLSCGVVATPGPTPSGFLPLPRILDQSAGRADALLFLEVRRSNEVASMQPNRGGVPSASLPSINSQGRY